MAHQVPEPARRGEGRLNPCLRPNRAVYNRDSLARVHLVSFVPSRYDFAVPTNGIGIVPL